MIEYTGCDKCKHTKKEPTEFPCLECEHNRAVDNFEPMTNADRIRNMTDEELAEFLTGDVLTVVDCCDCDEPENEYGSCIGDCKKHYLKWLQAEVKEGAE